VNPFGLGKIKPLFVRGFILYYLQRPLDDDFDVVCRTAAFTAGFLLAYLLNGVDLTAPNFINMDEEESLRKVVTGEIDAAFLTTTLNSKLLTQLGDEKTPIRLLAINTKEIPVKIKEMYHTEIIPQNTYPWQKEAVEVPATATFLLVSKQTDPKDVKKIIEIIVKGENEVQLINLEIWT
jgi:TRAP-type uncharacterized transport system substrate-binding protein